MFPVAGSCRLYGIYTSMPSMCIVEDGGAFMHVNSVSYFCHISNIFLHHWICIKDWISKNVTQRGTWYPSGDLDNSSKSIIKGYMEENMKNRQILFKTFTKVEFHGGNDEIKRNIESCMTIALWEIFWYNVFNPLVLRVTELCMLPWQQ